MWLLLGCLARTVTHQGVGELPVIVNPDDPRRPYVQVVNGWGTTTWFLDTGYGATTCDDDFVEDIGVQSRASLTWQRGVGGSVRLRKSRLEDFQLGTSTVEGFACATRDLATTSSVPDGVDGVLGSDVLAEYVVELDNGAGVLRLHPPGTPIEGATFPLRSEVFSPRIKAPLELDGEPTWILVDTGASSTWLRAAPWEPDATDTIPIEGTGGVRVIEVRYHHDPTVGLAGVEVQLDTLREQDEKRAVLGMDVLGAYEQVWLDYAEKQGAVSPDR